MTTQAAILQFPAPHSPASALRRELQSWQDEYARIHGYAAAEHDCPFLGEMALGMIVHASAGRVTITRHVDQMAALMAQLDCGRQARFDTYLYLETLRFLADDCDDPADYLRAIPECSAIERTLRVEALHVLNAEIVARREGAE